MKSFKEKVYNIVAGIPRGRVLSYGEVARLAGSPGAARAVGTIMKNNPHPKESVPCHRVVKSDYSVGEYGRGGKDTKVKLLKSEGLKIEKGLIVGRLTS